MEGQGAEISNKIRSAIKAKLMELGAYVDQELPDYVMVMIANKKTKQQMTDDLSLFLGKNADLFTTWLNEVLERLHSISAQSAKSCVKSPAKGGTEKSATETPAAVPKIKEAVKEKEQPKEKDKEKEREREKEKEKEKERVKQREKEKERTKEKDKEKEKPKEREKEKIKSEVVQPNKPIVIGEKRRRSSGETRPPDDQDSRSKRRSSGGSRDEDRDRARSRDYRDKDRNDERRDRREPHVERDKIAASSSSSSSHGTDRDKCDTHKDREKDRKESQSSRGSSPHNNRERKEETASERSGRESESVKLKKEFHSGEPEKKNLSEQRDPHDRFRKWATKERDRRSDQGHHHHHHHHKHTDSSKDKSAAKTKSTHEEKSSAASGSASDLAATSRSRKSHGSTSEKESRKGVSSSLHKGKVKLKKDKLAAAVAKAESKPAERRDDPPIELNVHVEDDIEDETNASSKAKGMRTDQKPDKSKEATSPESSYDRQERGNIPRIQAPPTNIVRPMKRSDQTTANDSGEPVRRRPVSIVAQTVHHEEIPEEEYDPFHPAIGNVASVVRVTQRRTRLPTELQAKPSIFLRAISEATGGTSLPKNVTVRRAGPIPQELFTRKRRLELQHRNVQSADRNDPAGDLSSTDLRSKVPRSERLTATTSSAADMAVIAGTSTGSTSLWTSGGRIVALPVRTVAYQILEQPDAEPVDDGEEIMVSHQQRTPSDGNLESGEGVQEESVMASSGDSSDNEAQIVVYGDTGAGHSDSDSSTAVVPATVRQVRRVTAESVASRLTGRALQVRTDSLIITSADAVSARRDSDVPLEVPSSSSVIVSPRRPIRNDDPGGERILLYRSPRSGRTCRPLKPDTSAASHQGPVNPIEASSSISPRHEHRSVQAARDSSHEERRQHRHISGSSPTGTVSLPRDVEEVVIFQQTPSSDRSRPDEDSRTVEAKVAKAIAAMDPQTEELLFIDEASGSSGVATRFVVTLDGVKEQWDEVAPRPAPSSLSSSPVKKTDQQPRPPPPQTSDSQAPATAAGTEGLPVTISPAAQETDTTGATGAIRRPECGSSADDVVVDSVVPDARKVTTTEDDSDDDDDDDDDDANIEIATSVSGSAGPGSRPASRSNSLVDATSTTLASMSGSLMGPGAPRSRIMERCRFWPACKQADACAYHHPTAPCLTFPDCRFGDKCLYIHPNCKYDANCCNPKCPFTHASRRTGVAGGGAPIIVAAVRPYASGYGYQSSNMTCRYGAGCTNPSCSYIHPKKCMFGDRCTRPDCSFSHPKTVRPSLPPSARGGTDMSKFRWNARLDPSRSTSLI